MGKRLRERSGDEENQGGEMTPQPAAFPSYLFNWTARKQVVIKTPNVILSRSVLRMEGAVCKYLLSNGYF